MIWPQSILFRALLKTKKDLKCTFISFSSFDNSEKGTPRVFFQLFSNSDNVKILPSTWIFELVKVNDRYLLSISLTLFQTEIYYLRKRNTLIKHDQRGSLRYYFTLFRIRVTNLRKSTFWSSLSSSFSDSLNMKKDWAITIIKLVKT